MKIKKRYLALSLTALLIVSPINPTQNRIIKASYLENVVENFSSFIANKPTEIEEVSINYKLTKPLELKEVFVYGEKPRFENIDKEKRKIYLSNKDLNHYVDSLYKEIWVPKEVSKNIFKKIIKAESAYNIYALSNKDARGLGQIKEITWNSLEKEIPYEPGVYNPTKNLEVSLKLLKWTYNHNKAKNPHWNELDLNEKRAYMLATYNWGSGKLRDNNWDLEKAPKETKNYINYILNN